MTPEAQKYLSDMLERAEYLVEFCKSHDLANVESDRVIRTSMERELMVLCEALYLLDEHDSDLATQVPKHREIIATRHRLVHGYSTIQPLVLREIILTDVPNLLEPLRRLLAEEDVED